MISRLFRITHQDGEGYHSALSGSLKISSVHQQHTDLDFYCAGGKKVSCHRAFVLRFSTTLSTLVQKQTCCECFGEECKSGQDAIGISLADVQPGTLMGLLDLLYTGKTTSLKKKQDADKILHLANVMLGIRLTKAQLSLEAVSNGQIQGNIDFRRARTISVPRPTFNEMADVILSDEDSDQNIPGARLNTSKRQQLKALASREDTDSDLEGEGKRKCPKCRKAYSTKWLTRHMNACTGEVGDEIEMEEPALSPVHGRSLLAQREAHETNDLESKPCPHCGKFFKVKGGWVTRHAKSCDGKRQSTAGSLQVNVNKRISENRADRTESRQVEIVSPPPPVVSDDRSPCPKCGDYFQNRGGAFFKHLNLCSVVPSQGSAASSLSDISCKKCGKIYPLNKRKNLIKHEEFCAGPDQTDLSSKENNEIGDDSSQNYAVDPMQALALYNSQNWKCFLCGSVCRKRDGMKAHLVLHFRNNLEAEEPKTYESLQCSRCSYVGSDKPILFIHIALTHQVLRKYIPSCLHDILFSKHTLESAKHAKPEGNPTPSVVANSPGLSAPVATPLTSTFTVDLSEAIALYESSKVWTCFVCKEVFKIKNNFKYHMIKHYRPDLRKFLNEAAPTLCPVCGLNGANYDSTLGHVAWTHQKIRELLTPEQGNYLFGEEGATAKKKVSNVASPIKIQDGKIDSSALKCIFCGSLYSRRSELKNCLMSHVKPEVEKKYFTNGLAKECSLCEYRAGSKDHLLTHMCLTHRKICDFLTPEYSELVFGKKKEDEHPSAQERSETGTLSLSQGGMCRICNSSFPTDSDLKKHEASCGRVSCDKCKELFADAAALNSHKSVCNRSTMSFVCHLCEKSTFEHPHLLKGHLSTHYKSQLLELVASDTPDDTGYYRCITCDYMTPTKDSLAVHLGYKHSMFVQFLPKEVSERYRIFAESASLKDATVEPSNGETRTDENRHECQKCKKSFPSAALLASHITSGDCRSAQVYHPKKSKLGGVKCVICEEAVGSFLQYKCHLYAHFEELITKDWGAKYEKDHGKCFECGSNDSFVEGEKLSSDGRSAFVRHLALDHDKIFTYLSPAIRKEMRSAFSEGPIALPPTPPPQTNAGDPVEFMEIEPFSDSTEDVDIQIEAVEDDIKIENVSV